MKEIINAWSLVEISYDGIKGKRQTSHVMLMVLMVTPIITDGSREDYY